MTPYYHSLSPEELSGSDLDQLLALGWYRMHQSIFTSSHIGLDEPYRVHWLRYSLSEIRDHTSHRRIRNRNKDFRFSIEDFKSLSAAQVELHHQYRASINFDGALSIADCLFGDDYSGNNIYTTKCISVFDQKKLIAVGYFDVGEVSAASILHFFDPAYGKYSPGKYLILLTIDYLRHHRYTWYYPGYIIEGLPKMDYKLFLGKESAQYFDQEAIDWKYFSLRQDVLNE